MDSGPVAMQVVLASQAHEIESFLHQVDEKGMAVMEPLIAESMINSLNQKIAVLLDQQSQIESANSEFSAANKELEESKRMLQSQADNLEQQLKEAQNSMD